MQCLKWLCVTDGLNTSENKSYLGSCNRHMDYNKEKVLGEGCSAFVFRGTFNGKEVAVKRIQNSNLDENTNEREENTMKNLNHPNVLKLLHVQQDQNFKYLILELCDYGTLSDYVKGHYKRYNKSEMPSEIDGMIQMASGLHYIHSNRFVHRDIKPANVLISPTFILKISDFGFSRGVTGSGSFSMSSGPKGTRAYYSPEFLSTEEKTKEEKEQIRVDVSIDVFSLGCLFFNYLTMGGHPFANGGPPNEVLTPANILNGEKILNGRMGLPENHYAYAMIEKMTEKDPGNRWKLEKALETLNEVKRIERE